MRELGNGSLRLGVAHVEFGIVNVRDVAEGRLRAALIPEASGRHILVGETMGLPEVVRVLRSHFGNRFPFPRFTVPRVVAALSLLCWGFRGGWSGAMRGILSASTTSTRSRIWG